MFVLALAVLDYFENLMQHAMVSKFNSIAMTADVSNNGNPYKVIMSCEPMMHWLPKPISAPPQKQCKADFKSKA
jgi:hypothetical protein